MSAFDKVLTLQDDFYIELVAFRAAEKGMQEIIRTIKERQSADKAAAETRWAELSATAADISRPETVRRLAKQELSTVGEYRPRITEAEAAAYQEERCTAQAALADLRKTVVAITQAIKEARAELDKIRGETCGKACFDTWVVWLEHADNDFVALREVQR